METHSKQAIALTLFLTAFVVLAGTFASANILLAVLAVALLAAAIFVFMQCKKFERES